MKNSLIVLALVIASLGVSGQKFAYVDSKYILDHIPEYATAQTELNRLSGQWQQEVESKYSTIDKLTEAYQAEKVLLPEDMKKRREEEIEQKRQEARDLQKKYFGVEGELFKRREQLIKPIQDQIYEALQELSADKGYMVIFDKGSQTNMLYANPKHDVSDQVIRKLGLNPGEQNEQNGGEEEKENESGGAGAKPAGAGGSGSGGTGGGGSGTGGSGGTVPKNRK
jgi:outer membrane protein